MVKINACIVLLCLCSSIAHGQMDFLAIENSKVDLPFGDLMMATAAYPANYFSKKSPFSFHEKNIKNILGFPDLIPNDNTFYEIKGRSSLILVFGDHAIENLIGKDIFIFGEGEFKGLRVSISANGKKWVDIGKVDPDSKSINLRKFSFPPNYYKFLRLTNGAKQSTDGSKILVDAVAISIKKNQLNKYFPIANDTIFLNSAAPLFRIKDSKIIDGDAVEVNVDQLGKRKILIGPAYTKIKLETLSKGMHKLSVTALNRGFIPPNTFRLEVVDGDTIYYKTFRMKQRKTIDLNLEIL